MLPITGERKSDHRRRRPEKDGKTAGRDLSKTRSDAVTNTKFSSALPYLLRSNPWTPRSSRPLFHSSQLILVRFPGAVQIQSPEATDMNSGRLTAYSMRYRSSPTTQLDSLRLQPDSRLLPPLLGPARRRIWPPRHDTIHYNDNDCWQRNLHRRPDNPFRCIALRESAAGCGCRGCKRRRACYHGGPGLTRGFCVELDTFRPHLGDLFRNRARGRRTPYAGGLAVVLCHQPADRCRGDASYFHHSQERSCWPAADSGCLTARHVDEAPTTMASLLNCRLWWSATVFNRSDFDDTRLYLGWGHLSVGLCLCARAPRCWRHANGDMVYIRVSHVSATPDVSLVSATDGYDTLGAASAEEHHFDLPYQLCFRDGNVLGDVFHGPVFCSRAKVHTKRGRQIFTVLSARTGW